MITDYRAVISCRKEWYGAVYPAIDMESAKDTARGIASRLRRGAKVKTVEELPNTDNPRCHVRWSSDWPSDVGHWWLHRADRTANQLTLVRAALGGDGSLIVMSDAEIFYRQEQTDAWSFAKAVLPCLPNN